MSEAGSSDSGRWNREHPKQVRAARSRYAKKERRRRAQLTPLERAREDLGRLLRKLSPEERSELLEWARRLPVDDEVDPGGE